MSTESVDPELIEQTRQQIAALVREIEQLARSDVAPSQFYEGFLSRVVQALAALGGAVWAPGDDGRLQLQYQINMQLVNLQASEAHQTQHARLLNRVLTTGEPLLAPPHSGAAGDDEAANPTDFLLVLGPLKSDKEVRGVVEVFQRPYAAPDSQRGYLRFLMQMCERAGEFLKTRALRHFSDRQVLWTQLENFARVTHASLDPRETAYTVANEGRRLIGCDRVTIALSKGSKCTVSAISGQDLFDKRSTTVTLLNRLATAVVAAGEPLWYTGDTRDLPPQVEEAIQAYVDESHSKTVAVLPLFRPRPDDPGRTEAVAEAPQVVGALVVEQIEDSRLRDGFVQRVEVVCNHSSTALANAQEYHSLFLLPVWKTLGQAAWVLRARTLPKTIAVATAVLVAVAALVFVPADFAVEADGELRPVVRKDVFATEDGTVKRVPVAHGAMVVQGEVLAHLESTTLEVEVERTLGELNTATEESSSIEGRLRHSQEMRDKGEKDRLIQRKLQLQATIDSASKQLDLLRLKQQNLEIVSPIDGQLISSWNTINELLERPVKRGDKLLQVADPSQAWDIELMMAEDRMGHVGLAQRDLQPELKVTYILATDPGTTREGQVREVHRAAEVRGEDGNSVLIRVSIDKQELAQADLLRPGASVTAKVFCGRRSVGFVWFHDLFAWCQKQWFRHSL